MDALVSGVTFESSNSILYLIALECNDDSFESGSVKKMIHIYAGLTAGLNEGLNDALIYSMYVNMKIYSLLLFVFINTLAQY